MTIATTVADDTLRESVWTQLEWTTEVDASMIGVSAHEGVVTLTGYVKTYAEKLAAERTARRVHGVKAIANDIEVRLSVDHIDPDIARDAVDALRRREGVPPHIDVTVRHGHVTLSGTVDWHYQRQAAERAVRYLKGVRGVANHIVVKPKVSPGNVQKHIVSALHRAADIEARHVHVIAEGSKVTLAGNVRTWNQRQLAENAAWSTNGVAEVDNQIVIVP